MSNSKKRAFDRIDFFRKIINDLEVPPNDNQVVEKNQQISLVNTLRHSFEECFWVLHDLEQMDVKAFSQVKEIGLSALSQMETIMKAQEDDAPIAKKQKVDLLSHLPRDQQRMINSVITLDKQTIEKLPPDLRREVEDLIAVLKQ